MTQLALTMKTERRLTAVFNSILVLLIWALFFWAVQCEEPAQAEDERTERQETVLRLSQCVIGECDHCKTNSKERNAIGHCLKKQAWMLKKTLLKQTVDYCAFYKQKSARSRRIYSSTFLKPLHGIPGKEARLWNETRRWARSFLANPPPDPIPEADQWGGDMDIPRADRLGLRRIAGPPEYANTFLQSRAFARLFPRYTAQLESKKP